MKFKNKESFLKLNKYPGPIHLAFFFGVEWGKLKRINGFNGSMLFNIAKKHGVIEDPYQDYGFNFGRREDNELKVRKHPTGYFLPEVENIILKTWDKKYKTYDEAYKNIIRKEEIKEK